MVCVLQTREE